MRQPRSSWQRWPPRLPMRSKGSPVVSKVGEPSFRTLPAPTVGTDWTDPASPLGNISIRMILQEKRGTFTSLITGKEVPVVYRNSLMSEPLIVVINEPPSLAATQVQYIPHPSSRGPMTSAKELKTWCEDRENNRSRVFLLFCVRKNEMLESRFKNWANLLNCLVNSMEDHGIRVFCQDRSGDLLLSAPSANSRKGRCTQRLPQRNTWPPAGRILSSWPGHHGVIYLVGAIDEWTAVKKLEGRSLPDHYIQPWCVLERRTQWKEQQRTTTYILF